MIKQFIYKKTFLKIDFLFYGFYYISETTEVIMSSIGYTCQFCHKTFNHKSNLSTHLSSAKYCLELQGKEKIALDCEFCKKGFANKYTLAIHHQSCEDRVKVEFENKIAETVKNLTGLYEQQILTNSLLYNEKIAHLQSKLAEKDVLLEKMWIERDSQFDKIIARDNPVPSNVSERMEQLAEESKILQPIHMSSLILNGIQVNSRHPDHYVNATQLCEAGGHRFTEWSRSDTSKEVITLLSSETGIPVHLLVESKRGNDSKWIHPDLAIYLAHWISPCFGVQVSRWVRSLLTPETVAIDWKMMKMYQDRVEQFEQVYHSRKRRVDHNEKNVVYLLTTADHLKRRTYIVGKTKDLTNRLNVYNKSCNHIVVYSRECPSEEDMSTAEVMVLSRLRDYREQANRDRFILPVDKDESFFISTIDDCVDFVSKK